jgi:hypothetical protein
LFLRYFFTFPDQLKYSRFFLVCNIDTLDQEFIGWSDPFEFNDFWVSTFGKLTGHSSAHQSNSHL